MANTYGNYNETFFAQEALIQLEKVMGMAGRVYRDYSTSPSVKGDTIQIRRPSNFTAQNAPATAQNVATESVAITLNKWKEVKFALTDKDLALTSERIISDHIRPAAVALADQIDQDLISLYFQIPWAKTFAATPVLSDVGVLRKQLFDNKAPMRDGKLHLMVDGAGELAFLNAMAASGMMSNQQDPSLREGSLGRLYGFDAWANQNTAAHVGGISADSTGAIVGVFAVGATAITFNAVTIAGTWNKGDIIIIAGDPQQYAVQTTTTADGAGQVNAIPIFPALKKATAGGEVVTAMQFGGATAKNQNLAFHTNAFALATAPLSDLGNQLGAKIAVVNDPITSISLRSRMFYIGDTSTVNVALDVLYGIQTLDPNLAVRGSNA